MLWIMKKACLKFFLGWIFYTVFEQLPLVIEAWPYPEEGGPDFETQNIWNPFEKLMIPSNWLHLINYESNKALKRLVQSSWKKSLKTRTLHWVRPWIEGICSSIQKNLQGFGMEHSGDKQHFWRFSKFADIFIWYT